MRYWLNIVIAMLMFISNVAYADNTLCYAPSPNLSKLGDAYYDLENTIQLAADTRNQINGLLNHVAGQWQGQALQMECRGPDRAPEIKRRDMSLDATIKQNATTSLSIQAKKHNQEQNLRKAEQLSLLGNRPTFDLVIAIGQQLTFSERYRLINQPKNKAPAAETSTLKKLFSKITGPRSDSAQTKKPKSTRMIEVIYDFKPENNRLRFTRSYYTNGVFTGREQWHLLRD